ncbi:hypothetical protein A2943_00380 [Candidatus Adlerbacteria bacterium RIFCSPLOWO2_01_FULL_51_16]|uniref:Uncharacterized protein n=1 Tax=Candidatus Adlerbacteria bacterium RIFCSPLOWO2_01_FULL_51_16 TaxID=1797243 RepID=A0A1F4XH56_9BACT|nr:MAG: hypothetical protein A2943_00380 [Candidatus Adlerbacteria bacterium RIFCSPLOWO2_01_FULL_51_16]
MQGEILKAKVNSFIGCLFLGSFALWAGLTIWQTAFDENLLINTFEKYTFTHQVELDPMR